MILVDSQVWIDHLRHSNAQLQGLLEARQIMIHPFVIGELALGYLHPREIVLAALKNLPHVIQADDHEVLRLIEDQRLSGLGIGYVDAHLLASARLTSVQLWTHDKRLQKAAAQLSLAFTRIN